MLRYLPGLLLVQLVTLGLFALNADADMQSLALRAGLPAMAVTLVAALWFRSIARADSERDLARTRLEHERERDTLHRRAADDRIKVERDAAKTIRREERRTGRRANAKVGLAFAATAGLGVLFVLSELVTLGLLTLTTGGGALGGYLLRWRQTRVAPLEMSSPDALDRGALVPRDDSPGEVPDVAQLSGPVAGKRRKHVN